jgi:hypothetical protein
MPKLKIASLAQALEISDEARVITLGKAPFRIVHTNRGERRAPPPHIMSPFLPPCRLLSPMQLQAFGAASLAQPLTPPHRPLLRRLA